MLDQIVSELYQNFLSKKATCESNQSLSKLRSKRAIGDQSFGASSGYGSDCCPPVVDPLTFIALLGFIAAATYFLQRKIIISECLCGFVNKIFYVCYCFTILQ